jgi:lipoprotein NlpI
MRLPLLLALAIAAPAPSADAVQASRRAIVATFEQAVEDFLDGRIAESAAGFDEVARLAPESAPELWQRGIALYYAGRYADCRAQFESHRLVNPNDVENAAWHFLCVARQESPERARAALLPVGPDSRTPMREIYDLFRGELTPDRVLAAAGTRPEALFYAHLYLGLYFDGMGDRVRAREHIAAAAAEEYAPIGGYMHAVARIHRGELERLGASTPVRPR